MREHIEIQSICEEDRATRLWLEDTEPYVRIDDALSDSSGEIGTTGLENDPGLAVPAV